MYIYIICGLFLGCQKENHRETILQTQKENFSLMGEADKATVMGDIIGCPIFPGHKMIITAYNNDGTLIREWTLTYPQFGWNTRRYIHAWETNGFYMAAS